MQTSLSLKTIFLIKWKKAFEHYVNPDPHSLSTTGAEVFIFNMLFWHIFICGILKHSCVYISFFHYWLKRKAQRTVIWILKRRSGHCVVHIIAFADRRKEKLKSYADVTKYMWKLMKHTESEACEKNMTLSTMHCNAELVTSAPGTILHVVDVGLCVSVHHVCIQNHAQRIHFNNCSAHGAENGAWHPILMPPLSCKPHVFQCRCCNNCA